MKGEGRGLSDKEKLSTKKNWNENSPNKLKVDTGVSIKKKENRNLGSNRTFRFLLSLSYH